MKKGREIFVIYKYLSAFCKYLSAFYKYLSAFYKNLSAFLQTSLGLLQNNKNLSAFHKNLSGIQKAESSGSTFAALVCSLKPSKFYKRKKTCRQHPQIVNMIFCH